MDITVVYKTYIKLPNTDKWFEFPKHNRSVLMNEVTTEKSKTNR